ncbi:hypothetical protein KUTeg_009847 [Tegillarca granosa]|uniref:VWFA domain-containing protein n=1 Tax=Tegillarca granosa TaxID=220873 RepID=A0ABQ9F519_TEGGR|nr:hypothetical protein KUTeg_009847 [Tegillarca granosa]
MAPDIKRFCQKAVDVAFVVDSSTSIYIEDFKLQITSIHDIVDLFEFGPGKAHFAAVSFSEKVDFKFNFNSFSSKRDVLKAINNITYPGGNLTCTYHGLESMRKKLFHPFNGSRPEVPHVAVVFTDGNTNCGSDSLTSSRAKEETIKEAKIAKKEGFFMFAIGIGPNVNITELKAIASVPYHQFMQTVPSFSTMDTAQIRNFITNYMCTESSKTTPIKNLIICVQTTWFPSHCELICTKDKCLIQPDIIDIVNSNKNSWKADNYSTFVDLKFDALKYKTGTSPPDKDDLKNMTIITKYYPTLPKSFDARDRWEGYIHTPEDQGFCGGSWAFSTAGVVADRVAIQTCGKYTLNLSSYHLLSCATKNDGCKGGSIDKAWQFLNESKGILIPECYEGKPFFSASNCYRSISAVGNFCPDEFLFYIKMGPPYRIDNEQY